MTVREACKKGTDLLEQKGIPEASLDAWYLLEHVTGISRALYFSDGGNELEPEQEAGYFALIEKRGQRIPLQHLTGVQEFMGLSFQVNEHVLIPRQDTETLAEAALAVLRQEAGPVTLLDLCTGSGCILLSILKLMCRDCGCVTARPGTGGNGPDPVPDSGTGSGCVPDRTSRETQGRRLIWGTGSDISGPALETAVRNAELLGIQAEFCRGDLFEPVNGRFSMIVSNPPYIRTSEIGNLQEEVRDHDPLSALDGGADGLDFYRRIIRECREYLLPGGHLLLEIGYGQAETVAQWMKEAGFRRISVKKDLAGLDRVVSGVYDEAERG